MKSYRITVTVLLALLALSAAAGLFSFALGSIQEITRQRRQRQDAAARSLEAETAALASEHAEWRGLPAALREFRRRHIISLDDFARFRRNLNLHLDNNGLPAPDIRLQFDAGKGGGWRRVSLRFSVSGPYRSLKKFIHDMEAMPQMQFFSTIALNSRGSAVSGNFLMEAYLEE